MTQQNKGAVSKIFYNIRKNRVAYLEIKWKRQKDLQFGRLVVVVVVQNTQKKKEAEDENWQKNAEIFYIFLVSNPM